MLRSPYVAGQFYPHHPLKLRGLLEKLIPEPLSPVEAFAIVVPHAGYDYSGRVAGETYAAVRLPRKFVILCPNHSGQGADLAIWPKGAWETPLGRVDVDQELAGEIMARSALVRESPEAHLREHSLEVQLPFLQVLLGKDFQFVPMAVGTEDYTEMLDLGRSLGTLLSERSEKVLLISSSDMNHFESAERTMAKDELALRPVLELNSRGLYEAVHRHRISMCGYGPTVIAIEAPLVLGAKRARLVRHTHSGEVTGDNWRVVGYAGVVIE
jgi:MEMO1 family protein